MTGELGVRSANRTSSAALGGGHAWLSNPSSSVHVVGTRRPLPQYQPHSIRAPRRELGAAAPAARQSPHRWAATPYFRIPPPMVHVGRRSLPTASGIVKCARIWEPVRSAPQPQAHLIRGPAVRPRLISSSPSVHLVGSRRPLRAYCEVRAHPARRESLCSASRTASASPVGVRASLSSSSRRSTCSEPAGRLGHMV